MDKEFYHRFTEIYLPGQPDIKNNNDLFSGLINKQLEKFSKQNKVSSYRIINCETQTLPPPSIPKSDLNSEYVMLVIHIAYCI
jgi:hypothetical protein